jgi:LuxR family transcriptional regulator, maltose regulon positive regulatory protein
VSRDAVKRVAGAALAAPKLPEPFRLVLVPSAQALAWFDSGYLAKAAEAAGSAEMQTRRLGFGQHFFAVDYLRTLAGLALERRDLDTADRLTEQALSISGHGRAALEFLALLDRAGIWAARGQVRDALATVEAARLVLGGSAPVLLARGDELEALLRLPLGDLPSAGELASGLPASRPGLLLARIALDSGDHHGAQEHLQAAPPAGLTPRRALVRQILLAAAAIGRGDPATPVIVAGALDLAAARGSSTRSSPPLRR